MAAADLRYGCPTCRAVFRTGFSRCPSDGSPIHLLDGDPLVGERFADRYLIEACAAEGGMGRIYRARHLRVSRRFAIKVLFGELATDPKMRERFTREAEAASRLDHPNVGAVVDFGETDAGLLYLVMDFIEGRSLSDLLAAEAPLSAARARRLVAQLAAGLGHAHDQDLIHRDFKPDNVLVTGSGNTEHARIVDFGIALTTEQVSTSRLTTRGIVIGTPAYMAPEQATGYEIDRRADLFALGVIFYEMLSGVLPFTGTQRQLAAQHLAVPVPPIAERVPGLEVDPALEAIAHKLMAKQPEDRYPDARSLLAALEAAAPTTAQIPRLTSQTETTAPVPRAPGPRRRAAIAVGAALVSIAMVAALVRWSDEPSVRTSAASPAEHEGASPTGTAAGSAPAEHEGASPAETAAANAPAAVPEEESAAEPDAASAEMAQQPAPETEEPAAGAATQARSGEVSVAAERRTGKRAGRQSRRPADKRTTARPAASEPTASELQALYVSVGRALHRLDRNDRSVAQLYRRYERIAIADALRKPALRREALRTLRALESDVSRARAR